MKYPIVILTLLLTILCLPSCLRDATVTGLPAADHAELEKWRHHYLFGLVRGVKDVDLSEVCPQGVAIIQTKQNGWNGVVSVLTVGIYTPTKLNIYCADAPVTAQSKQDQVAQ